MTEQLNHETPPAGSMRKAGTFILDFITAFFASGFIIASLSGGVYAMTPRMLTASAAIMVLYFVLGRMLGGTLWQRVARMG